MSSVDVSVLVPCYNVEDYLDQALSSAEANDRISLEILVINDGSRDSSLDIMRKHAEKDSRIRIIDKANEGYGASMNRGLNEARGTYIAILEPDDWVNPHMYDDLVDYARSFQDKPDARALPDIVKTPYTRIWMPNTKHERHYMCSYYKRTDPGFQPFTLSDCPRLIQHHPSIWSALYRRDFLNEHNIRFKEVPGAGWVDNPFLIETLAQATSIVYLDKPYYNYREDLPNSSSVTRVSSLPIERWNDMCDVLDRLNVEDEGIRNSLGVVCFRYIVGLIDDGSLEHEDILEGVREMLRRLGVERILAIPNVSARMKASALNLIDEDVPHISSRSYRRALIDEFFYTWHTNGIRFAFIRLGTFLQRRGLLPDIKDPSRTRSASI